MPASVTIGDSMNSYVSSHCDFLIMIESNLKPKFSRHSPSETDLTLYKPKSNKSTGSHSHGFVLQRHYSKFA